MDQLINILVVEPTHYPLNAQVFIADQLNTILINNRCEQGVIFNLDYIKGGIYLMRIRCNWYKPIEFYIDHDDDCDLQFCVRMELDL